MPQRMASNPGGLRTIVVTLCFSLSSYFFTSLLLSTAGWDLTSAYVEHIQGAFNSSSLSINTQIRRRNRRAFA
jgi:hypothetical protein